MTTVKQLLDRKGRKICSIPRDATVLEAIKEMAENDIGSLLVMDESRLIGLFTERHYARDVFLKGKTSPKTSVGEVMRTAVLFVRPEQTIEECMAVMSKNRVRHLPVLDGATVVGVISMGDLVNGIIADQQFVIEQLEHYIRG
jgi:CBS domain-containing protein